MATISETELQKRLRALENRPTASESNYISTVDPTAGAFSEEDTHYNTTTDNLWVFSGGAWGITPTVLHVRYADSVTVQPPVVQGDITGFSGEPINPDGSLKNWRGLWWGALVASTDSTDYEWFDTSTTPSELERYYTENSGLRSDVGTPTSPGVGIDWVLGSTTTNTMWVADRFTIDGQLTPWEVYPVQAESTGYPFISYTKTGFNVPAGGLTDAQWVTDVITAAQVFTGQPYTNVKELGYGTVVVITYDDAKLSGKYTRGSGVDTWVAPGTILDGDLVVDGSMSADKIQTNTITATQISAGTITASEIAVGAVAANNITMDGNIEFASVASGVQFGKTALGDAAAGAFFGRSGGVAGFNISSATAGIYADSDGTVALNNVRLYTGAAGSALEHTNPGTYTSNISSLSTSIFVIIVGAGAGACNTGVPSVLGSVGAVGGGAGTASWVQWYSGLDGTGTLLGTYTAAGGGYRSHGVGANNATASGYAGYASSQANSAGAGGAPNQAGFSGSRGGGGGGGGVAGYNYSPNAYVNVRAAAGSTYSQLVSKPAGAQSIKIFVGTGGAGGAYYRPATPNGNWPAISTYSGGDGGHGFVSVADPNTGGVEVDLLSIVNRLNAAGI